MRIAIIGSGISGLGSAYYLKDKHSIVLYEAQNYVGGHTRTKTIQYDDETINVDTGFIVFNHKNYPLLTQLFKDLDVATDKSDMSFGVSANNGAFEWCGKNLAGVFAQKKNLLRPWFYRMLLDIRKFNKHGTKCVHEDINHSITLGKFLDDLKLSKAFLQYYLLPMAGAIWSCPLETMREFPAKSFLTFFHNHGLLTMTQQPEWRTVRGGAKSYIEKILKSMPSCDIRLNCAVTSVVRSGETIFVTDNIGATEAFDKVIFACHGDKVLDMLDQPDPQEYETLAKVKYQPNEVILHSDISQMPKCETAWASWVYQTMSLADEDNIAVTYHMNNLQPHIPADKPLFVTLNPIKEIPSELIFDRVTLQHPIFTQEMLEAQSEIGALQGHRNCYYAGAWTGYGFHEDGLRSAYKIAEII